MIAVRLPAFLSRPRPMALRPRDVYPPRRGDFAPAGRRIAQLEAERDELARKLNISQDQLSSALDDLGEMRRHRTALARAVRNRSSVGLPADVVALIEEGALGE